MKTKLLLSVLFILNFVVLKYIYSQDSVLTFGASYTGDLVSNFSGGIKTGSTYLGFATINANFNLEKTGWWRGGEAAIKLANTHGGEPSATLIGDFQGVSNIEAGNLTWLYEFWYRQRIGNLTVTAGLQDLNVNFANLSCSGSFINSSFGIHSSIADNVPSPIFPLTALGLEVLWDITPKFTFKTSIYDGTPDDFEQNPFNLKWNIRKDEGFLAVSEFEFNPNFFSGKCGNYKAGVYYHQHNDTIDIEQKNGGVYFSGSQQITDKLTLFSQVGLSPKKMNNHNHFLSIGVQIEDIFNNKSNDHIGFAIAHAGINSDRVRSETAFELMYHIHVTENLYIRPDLQYVVNPAGSGQKLKNAFLGIIRVGFNI